MVKTISISIDDWIAQRIDGTMGSNRSQRIQELIIKGMMQEQEERHMAQIAQIQASQSSIKKIKVSPPFFEHWSVQCVSGSLDVRTRSSVELAAPELVHGFV